MRTKAHDRNSTGARLEERRRRRHGERVEVQVGSALEEVGFGADEIVERDSDGNGGWRRGYAHHFPPEVEKIPRVGGLIDPNVERLLSLRPDLVVVYDTQVELKRQIGRAGIPIYPYTHRNLADITQTMRSLGARVGLKEAADALARQIEQRLAAIGARVARLPRPKTLLVIGRDRGSLRNVDASGGYGFLHNPQDGTYTTLDDDLAGPRGGIGGGTFAQGINDVGQVVGYYTGLFSVTGPPGTFGFLYSGGNYTPLDVPAGTGHTFAYGINDAGQIVGYYSVGGVNHGFLYNGTYSTVDDPLATNGTQAFGINTAGQIVGAYNDASGHSHGFLYDGSTYTTLDDPSGTDTVATGINDLGQIVGHYSNGSIQHSFLYSAGAYITLDDPLLVSGIIAWSAAPKSP